MEGLDGATGVAGLDAVCRALIRSGDAKQTPLSVAFLLLRCAHYRPAVFSTPWVRRILDTKLLALCRTEGLASARAYLLDIDTVLERGQVAADTRAWLEGLVRSCHAELSGSTVGIREQRTDQPTPAEAEPSVDVGSSARAASERKRGVGGSKRARECQLFTPLSSCQIWDEQARFYLATGMDAWTSGCVPYLISSSPLMGKLYARAIRAFFSEHTMQRDSASCGGQGAEVYVIELGAGHCKLGFHVASALARLAAEDGR